ncbi:hypothetical protein F2Q69_00062068, partial [Brassica cretica]
SPPPGVEPGSMTIGPQDMAWLVAALSMVVIWVASVPLQQLKIVDHPNLQDGFGQVWSHDLLTEIISEEVISHDIHTIMTFDSYGVSGYCNHRDVHRGVVKFLQTYSERNIKAWQLASL